MTKTERQAAGTRYDVSRQLEKKMMAARPHPKTHAIIAAMFVRTPVTAARFVGKAIVTSDGFVQCNFIDSDGVSRHSAFVGSYDEVYENVLQTGRDIGISAEERAVLIDVIKDWYVIDYRSN